jgi:hypothetical protein
MSMTIYEDAYQDFRQQIFTRSPSAVLALDQMCQRHGVPLTYYAAFVLVWIEACVHDGGCSVLRDISLDTLGNFTFFELTEQNSDARALFTQALERYRTDCDLRFRFEHLTETPQPIDPG